ncbi:hypothetical protein FA13DRAFT_1773426 [Coprinellus micaceus]|uniref:Uncharacterized protein n=1 Tax=Coprinellus micaceus TaxID=71717 RepID=A0A4Y7TIB4_COPMI|nr:hypothetical protein FA13DRAFT_1773426 [Coprinellus micaceus]
MSSQQALPTPDTQISRFSVHGRPLAEDPQSPAEVHYPDVFRQGGGGFFREMGEQLSHLCEGDDASDLCLDLSGYTSSGLRQWRYMAYQTKKAVLKLAPRIRFLKLGREIPDGFRELYNPSSAFAGQFSRLEGLTIDVPHQYSKPKNRAKGDTRPPLLVKSFLACLDDIGSLRQLHLNFGPYDQAYLTASIRGSVTLDDCLLVLSQCTNATEIELDTPNVLETYPKPDNPKARRRLFLRLPKLRWLKIAATDSVEGILQRMESPNLENLFILNGARPEPFAGGASRRPQLVLAVNCSWKTMRAHANCLEGIIDIPEVDLRIMDPEEQDCAPKNVVGHWFGMTTCNSHEGYISHLGKTEREGVHIGTPLRPTDWVLGFWHTEDSLSDLVFSSSWKNSEPSTSLEQTARD